MQFKKTTFKTAGEITDHHHGLPGLDYLSYPTGAIQQAQRLAAAAFGAEQSWFLVNGTTAGRLTTCHSSEVQAQCRLVHSTSVCLAAGLHLKLTMVWAGSWTGCPMNAPESIQGRMVHAACAGIHAAVMATCSPDTALLVARNCHLAAYSALVLSGA